MQHNASQTYRHHGHHLLYALFTKLLIVHLHFVDALLGCIWVQEKGMPPDFKPFLTLNPKEVVV